jgi:2-polyprenyl-3-methyl-5-hydroxy-6-metoxy-1,4-benzoquinol methylase
MDKKFDSHFHAKRKHIAWRAEAIATQIVKQFSPKSVVDIGCSIGDILAELKKHGVIIQGIDASQEVMPYLMIPQDEFTVQDITEIPLAHRKHDIALCFMVIDHLPISQWNRAAQFLKAMSDVVVTVVSENQQKWTTIMRKNKFIEDKVAGEEFRLALQPLMDKTAVRSFQFAQVFRKKGATTHEDAE